MALMLCLGAQFSISAATAQDSPKVLDYVPNQALGVVSIWPSELSQRQEMELLPKEVATAAGLQNFGIDPLKLERVDLLIGMPTPSGPEFGAMITSPETIDYAGLNQDMLTQPEMVKEKSFEYYSFRGPEGLILYPVDDTHAIFGTRNFVKVMVDYSSREAPLAKLLDAVKGQQDALVLLNIEPLKPLLVGGLQSAELPQNISEMSLAVVENSSYLAARFMLNSASKLQVILGAADESSAITLENEIASLISFGRDSAVESMKQQIPANTPTGEAMHAYYDRLSNTMTDRMTPERKGSRLVLNVDQYENVAVIGTLTGLLLPAVQAAREAARRTQSSNNLKQLALSLFNYESAYRAFPSTEIQDDAGKPLLSWRVSVLPFLEELDLYNEFHLDEPWDSEHNIKLLERMPATFAKPGNVLPPGYTVYQAAVGENTMLQKATRAKFSSVTDGSSNTIMLVQTNDENAVPWTAPRDFDVDAQNPFTSLFTAGITSIGLGDGSVQTLSQQIDADILRALFTRNGGEGVNLP